MRLPPKSKMRSKKFKSLSKKKKNAEKNFKKKF